MSRRELHDPDRVLAAVPPHGSISVAQLAQQTGLSWFRVRAALLVLCATHEVEPVLGRGGEWYAKGQKAA